ncbi:MAG: hypothetical protein QM642_05665 [Edaphocola sp.]
MQVEGTPTPSAMEALGKGTTITIDGKPFARKPATAKLFEQAPMVPQRTPPMRFRKNIPTAWLSLTLTEGKNRQVRKMTASVGLPTLRLIRYRIGQCTIDGMVPGDTKPLSAEAVQQLLLK